MRVKRRMLSLLLCCTVFGSAFSGMQLVGKAEEKSGSACSYEEHEHNDECYKLETVCVHNKESQEEDLSETEGHTCTEESGCVTRVLDCPYAYEGPEAGEQKPEVGDQPENSDNPEAEGGDKPGTEVGAEIGEQPGTGDESEAEGKPETSVGSEAGDGANGEENKKPEDGEVSDPEEEGEVAARV